MGLDLFCTFLFAVILLVLVYRHDCKYHLPNSGQESKESFEINGDFEDYMYGDIQTLSGPDDIVTDCDYFVLEPKLFGRSEQQKSLLGKGINPYSLIYSDYITTQDEAMNATLGPRSVPGYKQGNIGSGSGRTFEYELFK